LEIIKGKKVLTVMLRCSKHYVDYQLELKNVINDLKLHMDQYDNILILTQIDDFLQMFVEIFGDYCIFPNRERHSGDVDWKGGRGIIMSNEEYLKEIEECIIDVVMASQTNHIISGASNMFLGALCINPDISFSIFDSLKGVNGA
jgi:hypothetical protein